MDKKHSTSFLAIAIDTKYCLIFILFNIRRIYGECGIEKSVLRITDWHQEACQVMTNCERKGRIILSNPHMNNGFFFLLIIKYHILYSKNIKILNMRRCNIILTQQLRHGSRCGQHLVDVWPFIFYLSHVLELVSHMGINNGNPDLLCKKKILFDWTNNLYIVTKSNKLFITRKLEN